MLIVTDWGLHVMVTYSLLLYLHHKIWDMLWSPVPNWNNNTITVIKVWTLKICTTVHIIFRFPLINLHHCLPIIIKLLEIPLIQAIVHIVARLCLKSFSRTSTFTVPLKLLGHLKTIWSWGSYKDKYRLLMRVSVVSSRDKAN